MVYAQAIAGSQQAAQFLSPSDPGAAPEVAVNIMKLKLQTYLRFNETYPGFAGFLPWFAFDDNADLAPAWNWVNLMPALDNGYFSPCFPNT
jgi:hypothetical protein